MCLHLHSEAAIVYIGFVVLHYRQNCFTHALTHLHTQTHTHTNDGLMNNFICRAFLCVLAMFTHRKLILLLLIDVSTRRFALILVGQFGNMSEIITIYWISVMCKVILDCMYGSFSNWIAIIDKQLCLNTIDRQLCWLKAYERWCVDECPNITLRWMSAHPSCDVIA